MRFRPLGDKVLIKRIEEVTTKTGIIIPTTSKDKPLEGEIVAISDEIEKNISVGDKVLYGKYAGAEVTIDGEDYLLMSVDDINGVLEDE